MSIPFNLLLSHEPSTLPKYKGTEGLYSRGDMMYTSMGVNPIIAYYITIPKC